MKKPRIYRWRWLFALLLGAAAWWGVGWWLGPRPWFEATFPLEAPGIMRHRDMPGDVDLFPSTAYAKIWDREGGYLFVELPDQPINNRYQLIDLQTRQTVAEDLLPPITSIQPNDLACLQVKSQPNLALPSGAKQFPIMRWKDDPPELVTALWEWNPITKTVRSCRNFPKTAKLIISQDGSTLLEIERCTPLWPSLLLASNLPNSLASIAEASLKTSDITLYRLWSLPEVRLRSLIAMPGLEGSIDSWNTILTMDGTKLVLTTGMLPTGFTSSISSLTRDNSKSPERRVYFYAPSCMRIHDSFTGLLTWQKTSHLHTIGVDSNLYTNDTLLVYLDGSTGSFHIPSKSLLRGACCKSSTRLNSQASHLVDYNNPVTILTVSDDGAIQKSSMNFELGIYPNVVTGVQQIVFTKQTIRSDTVPDWLSSFLWERKWLQEWLQESLEDISVIDYEKSRTLWSKRVSSEPQFSFELTARWLKFEQTDRLKNTLSVTVFAVPFPSWSPWWPRLAGFVIFLLTLFLLRHRRPKLT